MSRLTREETALRREERAEQLREIPHYRDRFISANTDSRLYLPSTRKRERRCNVSRCKYLSLVAHLIQVVFIACVVLWGYMKFEEIHRQESVVMEKLLATDMSGSKNTQIVQVEANQNAKNTKAVPVEANQNSQNTQVAQNKASQKAEALTQADEEYWDHGHHSKEELIDAHHGISLQDIAHIYGDWKVLDKCYKNTECDDTLNFRNASAGYCTDTSEPSLYWARLNNQNDIWCLRNPGYTDGRKRDDVVQLAAHTKGIPITYKYFKAAEWMKLNETMEHFKLVQDYSIRIMKKGFYLIQATVHYMSSSTAMRVIKETETDASTERKRKDILGHCMVSLDIQNATVDADEGSQLSCTVFQVAMLEKADLLFMDFTSKKLFRVSPNLLYMTVIKLNAGLMEDEN